MIEAINISQKHSQVVVFLEYFQIKFVFVYTINIWKLVTHWLAKRRTKGTGWLIEFLDYYGTQLVGTRLEGTRSNWKPSASSMIARESLFPIRQLQEKTVKKVSSSADKQEEGGCECNFFLDIWSRCSRGIVHDQRQLLFKLQQLNPQHVAIAIQDINWGMSHMMRRCIITLTSQ